jgi:cytochrome b6-f complex subunit 7
MRLEPAFLRWPRIWRGDLLNRIRSSPFRFMASEIFGTAALFWVLIPVGLLGGSLLLKVLKD